MFALRTFARGASRNTSRFASSYSIRSSIRPTLQITAKPSLRPSPATSLAFSTSSSRFDDASQVLAAKLNQELEVESENSKSQTDSDYNVQAFLSQNDYWTLEAKDGEQEVLMRRQYDDEEIFVSFSIADLNSPPMLSEDEADEAYADEEEDGLETAQSGGANTKGAVNQGRTSGGNIKVAPEDSVAPGDRDELRNEEVCSAPFPNHTP
jgi:complement component 1 Q subcomponent-binding protein, mitochondrial